MRKIITILLAATCAACLCLGIAACVPGDLKAHNWSKEWSHSFEEHWHVCTDPGCNGRGSLGEHDWQLVPDRVEEQPTCGTGGWGRYVCVMCGALKDDNIPPTGEHSYSFLMVTDPATCDRSGQELWVCDVCGSLESRDIPPTGKHQYSDKWESTAEGHYHVCLLCGAASDIIPHDEEHAEVRTIQPGSFSPEDGRTEYLCPECKYVLRTEPIPNPNVPVNFSISIDLNGGGSVEVTELDEKDRNGNPVLSAVLWAEETFPQNMQGTRNCRYSIAFKGFTQNGSQVALNHGISDGSQYRMRAYLSDMFSGKETPLENVSSGYTFDYTQLPFTLGIQRLSDEPIEIVFRYYTIVNRVEQLRAERILRITVASYNQTGRTSAAKTLSQETALTDERRRGD